MIVADSGPLNFLIRLEREHVLPALYGEVLLPLEAAIEMSQPSTPEAVRTWLDAPPPWLRIGTHSPYIAKVGSLHIGELAAIQHALQSPGCTLLMDDRRAKTEAIRRGVPVVGTLALLLKGASEQMLDFESDLQRLMDLGFRVSESVAQHFLNTWKTRQA